MIEEKLVYHIHSTFKGESFYVLSFRIMLKVWTAHIKTRESVRKKTTGN